MLETVKSLVFAFLIHLPLNRVADKTVQTFALTCGKVFNDLSLAFGHNDIDTVVILPIVSSRCFLLRIGISWHLYHILIKYTNLSRCKWV